MARFPAMTIRNAPQVGRVSRRPQHKFQLRYKPWQIQPFMAAPVLPGETMDNALLQARVVSDPIKHPLIGWWSEYYFFYVKVRDLDQREILTEMFLDQNWTPGELTDSANVKTYHPGGTIDWIGRCTRRIVDEYFRDEEEDWSTYTIDGLPAAQINDKTWLDSATLESNVEFPDVDVDADGDGTITASEISQAMATWQFMRSNGMVEMDYEDFLATYGVRTPKVEDHRPELLRYVRDWTYPSNTVDPATGVPSSAVVWSHTERVDKARFFREPGFVVGLTVCRPKVYLGNQVGSAVGMMTDPFSWLPAVMANDPRTSLKPFQDGMGPITNTTEPYWVDVKDLLLYGDQFVNFAIADAGSKVGLPTPALQKMFASLADADALFSGENKHIRSDGIVTLNIRGTQRETSATTNPTSVLRA